MFSIRQVSYKRTERRRGESGSEASAADKCGDGWPMNAAGDSIGASGCNESGGGDIRRRGAYLLPMRRRRVSALSGVGLTEGSAIGRILAQRTAESMRWRRETCHQQESLGEARRLGGVRLEDKTATGGRDEDERACGRRTS